MSRRPSVAVHKFSSCDGCQLQILNMEDELLDLAEAVDIAYFLEASSAARPGPYDISIVEGAVTTPHEIERLQDIRRESKTLVAIGTCSTAGGIQALRNSAGVNGYAPAVYPHPEQLSYLDTCTPISAHARVDLELWGCPVSKSQLLEVICSVLEQRKPVLPQYSVCMACKRAGTVCVLVAKGEPCLGPATRAGCGAPQGALCPANGRGCYGCFGPLEGGNPAALGKTLRGLERYPGEARRLFSHVSNYAPAFHETAKGLAKEQASHG